MTRIRIVLLACTLLAGLAVASPASGHPDPGDGSGAAARDVSTSALLGTWDLVLTFGDGSQVTSVLSVLPGRSGREGSIIHAATASLLLPNPTTPEQGTWALVQRRRFVATYYGFAVDSAFSAPAGRIGFKHAIEVSADGETFTGVATFEVLDTTGAVLFTDRLTTAGRRQHPVAP